MQIKSLRGENTCTGRHFSDTAKDRDDLIDWLFFVLSVKNMEELVMRSTSASIGLDSLLIYLASRTTTSKYASRL